MKKTEVKVKKIVDAEVIAQFLNDLAGSIREGTVCVENGNEFVTLTAESHVQFELELEASQKKNKQKLELELAWKNAPLKVEEEEVFKVSSKEPEITEPSPLEEAEVEETED